MNTKKIVLAISVAYIIYFAAILFVSGTCDGSVWCRIQEDSIWGSALFSLAPLALIFLLSLITYRMKEEVFRAWWRFAWWWSLIIVAATVGLNNAGGGGTLRLDQDFTILILSILYAVLIVTSLVKIVRTYLRTR